MLKPRAGGVDALEVTSRRAAALAPVLTALLALPVLAGAPAQAAPAPVVIEEATPARDASAELARARSAASAATTPAERERLERRARRLADLKRQRLREAAGERRRGAAASRRRAAADAPPAEAAPRHEHEHEHEVAAEEPATPDVIEILPATASTPWPTVQALVAPSPGQVASEVAPSPPAEAAPAAAMPSWPAPTIVAGLDVGPPLAVDTRVIGRPYGGTHTIGNWQSDRALDLAAPFGTPVHAVVDGVIGSRVGALSNRASRFAGMRLTLDGVHDSFFYAHLSRLMVAPGQYVRRGQVIGYSGSANGVPHLHIGVRVADPLLVFGLRGF